MEYGKTTTEAAGVNYIGSAAVARPPAPDCIGTHMDDLSRNLNALEEEISAMAQALQPIVRPLPQEGGKEGNTPTPIRSRLSTEITEQAMRVYRATRLLRALRESIDL